VRIQFGRLEARQERRGDADDDDDQGGFQAASMRDGSDEDGANDDQDEFRPPILPSNAAARSGWRVRHV
jgi:hypothetical protein